MNLRSVYEYLLRLLPTAEQSELRSLDSFSPFSSITPLQYNPYTQPLWDAAVSQHQRLMLPAEQKTATKLRQKFRQVGNNSQQVNVILKTYNMVNHNTCQMSIRIDIMSQTEVLLNGSLGEPF